MDEKETGASATVHNLADVMENGSRLSWDRKTAAIAIDRANKRVLKTGLGALGVGTMWVDYGDEQTGWADLPEQDSAGGFGALANVPVRMTSYQMPITRELVEDSSFLPPGVSLFEHLAEQERQFAALPLEEQQRIRAEREAAEAAAKLARMCEHCGCDPDEHGDR